jgi:hypothetical protein
MGMDAKGMRLVLADGVQDTISETSGSHGRIWVFFCPIPVNETGNNLNGLNPIDRRFETFAQ